MKVWLVYVLVLANVVAWCAGWRWPAGVGAPWWHFVAYGFSHGPWWHLTLNMVGLLTLGIGIERAYGTRQFALAYLVALLAAVWLQTALDPSRPIIGASGAIFGLLALYAALHPGRTVYLFILPMAARSLVVTYAAFEFIAAITGWMPAVGHWAHLGGIFGAVALWPFLERKESEHGRY